MKKPKRHTISSNLGSMLGVIFLIPLAYSIYFLSFEVIIVTSTLMLTLLFAPLILQTYVVVKNESIYKYDTGNNHTLSGKPIKKRPNISIDINKIERIEKITKAQKITGLLIFVAHHLEPTRIRTKTASELLKEILIVKSDIVVI